MSCRACHTPSRSRRQRLRKGAPALPAGLWGSFEARRGRGLPGRPHGHPTSAARGTTPSAPAGTPCSPSPDAAHPSPRLRGTGLVGSHPIQLRRARSDTTGASRARRRAVAASKRAWPPMSSARWRGGRWVTQVSPCSRRGPRRPGRRSCRRRPRSPGDPRSPARPLVLDRVQSPAAEMGAAGDGGQERAPPDSGRADHGARGPGAGVRVHTQELAVTVHSLYAGPAGVRAGRTGSRSRRGTPPHAGRRGTPVRSAVA